MTVPCEVQFFGLQNPINVAQLIEKNTHRLEQKYSFYSEKLWLSACLNWRQSEIVELDMESKLIFETVHRLMIGTQGTFDTTIGTIKSTLKANLQLTRVQAFEESFPQMGIN
jgi:thiamine biosynthesis lipoprotein